MERAQRARELCVHSFQNISRSSPMLGFGDPRPPSRRYVNSTFSSLTCIKMYYYILKSCVPFRFFRESVIDDLFLWKDIAVDSYDTLLASSSSFLQLFSFFLSCPAATQSIKQSFNQYQVSFLYSFFSSRARLHKRDLIISFQLLSGRNTLFRRLCSEGKLHGMWCSLQSTTVSWNEEHSYSSEKETSGKMIEMLLSLTSLLHIVDEICRLISFTRSSV